MLSEKEEYRIIHGDCIKVMADMPAQSVDFAVFSPPFPLVYAYQSDPGDLGNSEDLSHEAPLHFSWFFRGLLRVLKPGRAAICHCTQIPLLRRSGLFGLCDFRGLLIRIAQRCGLQYEYDWMIRVNPQAQAIRTHSHHLQFAGMEKDRAQCRGALGMYLIKFMAPGENAVPVDGAGEISRNDWIKLAEGCWSDIVETDTLNVKEARSPEDTRHICPMQLGIYERCIRLYTNPGELVMDPFAGVGSCGFVALGGESPKTHRYIHQSRKFLGIEMKQEYHRVAAKNCKRAIKMRENRSKGSLFPDFAESR